MRILQVVHAFPPKNMAGTELLTYHLSNELGDFHEIHVFYPVYREDKKEYSINTYKFGKIFVHELIINSSFIMKIIRKLLFLDISKLTPRNPFIERKFEELLKTVAPDIVHFQHLFGLTITLPAIAKKYCPVVITLTDYWLLCPTTHFLKANGKLCLDDPYKNCIECLVPKRPLIYSNRNSMKYFLSFIKSIFLWLTESLAMRLFGIKRIIERQRDVKHSLLLANEVIAISSTISKKFIDDQIINSEKFLYNKIKIITPGINFGELKGLKKVQSSVIRFGFVGGIAERKGVHVLISAYKKLSTQEAELKIYGKIEYKNDYHNYLLREASKCKNIKFLGEFDNINNIQEPFSNIDVLIVPSITYEGYAIVILEAFASKTPVIVSNIGAMNTFVENMKNGMLFEISNSNDLANKMQMICDNPKLIDQFKEGLPNVKSIKEYAKEYITIYENLVTKKI